MTISLSLCICTYNRCDQLRVSLQSLHSIGDAFTGADEILIIDNNSSDQTKCVVEDYYEYLPIRYIFEVEQGLSNARNRAIKEFRNDVLMFIDDDVTVCSQTIVAMREGLKRYPQHGFFGGQIAVGWQGEPASWYHDDSLPLINGLLVQYNLGASDLVYTQDMLLPYGANFTVRRDLIEAVGEFDVTLGVKGAEIGRGEESDYFDRALKLGFSGVYLADAIAEHRYQTDRLNLAYLIRYGKEKGRVATLHDGARPERVYRKILSFAVRGVYQASRGRIDRAYQCAINIGIQIGIMKHSPMRLDD